METIEHFLRVHPAEIHYIRWTLESYDGMALVSTADPQEGVVQIRISPGCEDLIFGLLDSLRKEEGLSLVYMEPGAAHARKEDREEALS